MFIYSAIILLHDPYAHVYSPGCVSAFKILEASRSILDLIYTVRSTSFDITLLDFFCAVRYLTPWSSHLVTDGFLIVLLVHGRPGVGALLASRTGSKFGRTDADSSC